MADINYMWVALFMGLFLIVSAVLIDTFRERLRLKSERRPPSQELATVEPESYEIDVMTGQAMRLQRLVRKPIVWTLTFVGLAAGLVIAGLLFVGEFGLPEGVTGVVQVIIIGLLGLLIAGYLVLGTWIVARRRGHPVAHALAETLGVVGLLIIAAIAGQLLL